MFFAFVEASFNLGSESGGVEEAFPTSPESEVGISGGVGFQMCLVIQLKRNALGIEPISLRS